jgi:cytosine/adenosine deaminase-related metal-dependent hydrolase
MQALVVDRVITGDPSQSLCEPGPYYVLYHTHSGRIHSVSTTPPDSLPHSLTVPLTRFPPGCTLLPGFIDCHVHLTIFTGAQAVLLTHSLIHS